MFCLNVPAVSARSAAPQTGGRIRADFRWPPWRGVACWATAMFKRSSHLEMGHWHVGPLANFKESIGH